MPIEGSSLREDLFIDNQESHEELLYSLQCICDNSFGVRDAVETAMLKLLKQLVGRNFINGRVALDCPEWNLVCGPIDITKELVVLSRDGEVKGIIQNQNKRISIFCLRALSRNEIKALFTASQYKGDLYELPEAQWERFKEEVLRMTCDDSGIEFSFYSSLTDRKLARTQFSGSLPSNITAKMLQIFYKYG